MDPLKDLSFHRFNRTILECKDVPDFSVTPLSLGDLIEPYWNVKQGNLSAYGLAGDRFNRTILECKALFVYYAPRRGARFNRTILECKG